MLTTDDNSKSDFYQAYPNTNCTTENTPLFNKRRGVFEQLEQLLGIGFDKRKTDDAVNSFSWDTEEEN